MPPTRVQLTHAQLQWLQEMQQLIDQEMTDREGLNCLQWNLKIPPRLLEGFILLWQQELGGIPAYRKDNPYQHFT
ncbi:hypothetical protein PtA15_14A476 [Puccinia triticina]|uniref:Uncharacterized protein n=1 Tax=Puccinia triticina TaxID=208348 RepID=A0ABY7D5P1_9BASI|nr:uncharacterized protein PtA15_14A476 [Puccinia triticina]WAQ91592.1 hypothetical protein PtA15_14A476 [Puccinia triticina]